jgi:hypothetical protein
VCAHAHCCAPRVVNCGRRVRSSSQLSTHAGRPDEKIDLNQLLTVINERTQNVKPLIVSWAKAAVEDAKRRSLHHNSAYSSSQRLPLLPMLAQQASTDSSVDHDTVGRELAKLANMEHEAHYTHHDDSLAALDHANAVLDDTASTLKHHLRAFLGEVTDVERLFRTFDKSQVGALSPCTPPANYRSCLGFTVCLELPLTGHAHLGERAAQGARGLGLSRPQGGSRRPLRRARLRRQ